ncbi:MAG: efflux RND transporter periplasmic adaptor subunit [Chloroflexota bacterium]
MSFNASKLILFIAIAGVITSCNKADNSIQAKKAELAKLRANAAEIQGKIRALESEIKNSGDGSVAEKVDVQVREVKLAAFTRALDVRGKIESDRVAMVPAKMGGPVISINVQPGQNVGAGALLMTVDAEVLKTSVAQIQTGLDFARTMYEKQKRLYDRKAISEVQYLQAKNQVDNLEKQLATTRQQIAQARITAPFAGVVEEVFPKLGEMVGPGSPVVRLTAMSGLKITTDISESYASTMKTGLPVKILIRDLNYEAEGRVRTVTKSIDPTKRTFRVEIGLPKNVAGLKPNMIVDLKINDYTNPNAVIIPLSIIQREGDKQFVFISNSGIAKKRYITTGFTQGDQAEIIGGLKPGDSVIIEGAFDVSDGQPLSIK